jgi:hypothetical protein
MISRRPGQGSTLLLSQQPGTPGWFSLEILPTFEEKSKNHNPVLSPDYDQSG